MPVSGGKLHDLHLASSLQELNGIVDRDGPIKTKVLQSTMDKLFKSAETKRGIDKDDEFAYVMYMRYVKACNFLSKEERKPYGNNLLAALKQAEELANRLQKRYDVAKECVAADMKMKAMELEDATATENLRKNLQSKSSGIVNGLEVTVQDGPALTVEQLKTLIDQKSTKFLLIDTRAPDDFSKSHLQHHESICIPSVELVTGISANLLTEKLQRSRPESVEHWKRRASFDLIVLYDWNSTFEQRTPAGPLSVLYDAITKWDPNTEYKGKVKVLQGGYCQCYRKYPTYFTGLCPSNGQLEESKTQSQVSMANIAYPKNLLEDPPPAPAPVAAKETHPIDLANSHDSSPKNNVQAMPVVHSIPSRNTTIPNRDTKPAHLITPIQLAKKVTPSPAKPPTTEIPPTPTLQVTEPPKPEPTVDPKPELNSNPHSNQKENKIEKLKPDGDARSGSSLKRSQSNPNLAQPSLDDTPTFNRLQKPQSRRDFPTVSSTLRHHRTGLKNLGNTCYMNSVVQCLSHTRDLANFLISDRQKGFGAIGDVSKEVGMTIQQLNRGSRSFAPEELKRVISKHNSAFSGYTQHDAHELLTFLLDWMHEELNKASRRKSKLKEQKNENVPTSMAYDAFRNDFLSVNNSVISQYFAGDQMSTIECLNCKKSSVTFEPFYCLSIPIPSGLGGTSENCIELYTAHEQLDMVCAHCKVPGETVKSIKLWRMPRYLLIHLQRFSSIGERNGNFRKKINEVAFPLDVLDMTRYVKGPTTLTSNRYELYAVSNHYGYMDRGHYTAYCRNPESWTKFDDADTSLISTREVCTTAAYILFYQARDDD